MERLVDSTDVEVVGDYRIRLTFADGTVGDVDFGEREWRGVFEPLADPAEFARVEVDPEAGTISWPGGLGRTGHYANRDLLVTGSPLALA